MGNRLNIGTDNQPGRQLSVSMQNYESTYRDNAPSPLIMVLFLALSSSLFLSLTLSAPPMLPLWPYKAVGDIGAFSLVFLYLFSAWLLSLW